VQNLQVFVRPFLHDALRSHQRTTTARTVTRSHVIDVP
jgi:hypothetical protein